MRVTILAIISTLLILLANVQAQAPGGGAGTFDVTKYGAAPNGEISQALMSAWKEACGAPSPSTVLIPKGEYMLNPVTIEGPCKMPIQIQLEGVLKAPPDLKLFPKDVQWITMRYISFLTITGGGVFNGQGNDACKERGKCANLPYNLSFNFINSSLIQDVTSQDSKNFHVNVLGCKNVTFNRFTISSPGESINTDGLHIAKSSQINVTDCTFGTGDDCIGVGDGTFDLYVTRLTCGPGHGVSIGSLGGNPGEEPVRGVYVKNCTFINTMNGARIKTRPDSNPGEVSDIHYEDIIMQNVTYPIVIDQLYCESDLTADKPPSKVKLSKMSFANIRGTSGNEAVVKFLCSKGVPCEDVTLADIDLTYSGPQGPPLSVCENVKPILSGKINPPACTNTVADLVKKNT